MSVTLVKSKNSKELVSQEKFYATGRRKSASARVWISSGSGKVVVNSKDVSDYFVREMLRSIIKRPFVVTETAGHYDVFCTVKGSGLSGQAGAISHGISRALDLATGHGVHHKILRDESLLTRDSREVERKKYGRKKARKRFQFSKR